MSGSERTCNVASRGGSTYRPDIDGLRAVAIIPVVLFHAGFPYLNGGYVGVDVFFVISGYVITLGIQDRLAAGTFTIRDFYERRIRRIIPALLFTIVLTAAIARIFLPPSAMAEFARSLTASAAFAANVYFWRSSGYFDPSAQTRPLLHLWSLSVEEQFYLFIPLVLYATWRFYRHRQIVFFVIAALASLVLSIYITDKAPSANFYLLPSRAWELLIGAVLALLPGIVIENRLLREVFAAIGLASIVVVVFAYNGTTPFPGAAALPPTLGAALLILVGRTGFTYTSNLLATTPLVAIGLISYSLYLVHWPIAVFTRYYLLTKPDFLYANFIVAASFALAVFSWRFVERPFRRRGGPQLGPRKLLLYGTAGLMGLAALGVVDVQSGGVQFRPSDHDSEDGNEPALADLKANVCFLVDRPYEAWKNDQCMRTTGASQNALLWGDSFAAHYVSGLIKNERNLRDNIIQYTFAGCPPVLSYYSYAIPDCKEFNAHVFDVIQKDRVSSVVLSARWDLLRGRGMDGLRQTVRLLTERHLEVYVIGQSPTFAFDTTVLADRRAGFQPDGTAAWTIDFGRSENEQIKALTGQVHFIDPLQHFCRGSICTYMKQWAKLYFDYGHFSDVGSDLAVRAYFPLYRAAPMSSASLIPK